MTIYSRVLTVTSLLTASLVSTVLVSFSLQAAEGESQGLPLKNEALQDSSSQDNVMEVIEVTSRQRKENIQEVPMAITVFGEQDIEDLGIERAADFISLTPNMTMVEAQNAGTSFITIRGLTQVRNGESPVAISVDGVLQISPNQFNQDLYDIAQIEILKGPQGALYGRNAIGGAINITTKAPTDELTGYAELDIGNGGLKALSGAVSGLMTDTINYRITASYKDFDGLIDNVYLNRKVDFQRDKNIRGRFIWEPSDDFSADLRIARGETEGGAVNYIYQPLHGINDANDTSSEIEANNIGENDRQITSASLKLDWNISDVTSGLILAADELTEYLSGDQFPYSRNTSATSPFGPNVFDGVQTQYLDTSSQSAELRFTSDDDKDFRWIAGLYYLQTERFISSFNGLDLGKGIPRVERTPPINDDISPATVFLADNNNNQAYALFAQFNYDVTDTQELSVSGRYDSDTREQTNRAPVSFDPNSGEVREKTFSKFQPKVSYVYTGLPNINLYANFSEGFRSGGFNQSGVGALAATAGLEGVSDLYKAEESSNFEVGIKGLYPDISTRFNASLFNTSIDNQHYFVFVGSLGAQVLTNIDEVSLIGGEFDFKTSVHDNIDLFGSFGMTKSEIKAYSLNPSDVGNKAPYVPEYTINLGTQIHAELFSGWLSTLTLDWEQRGKQYWDPSNSSPRDAINLVNARLGFNRDEGDWSVNLWAKNLGNEEYLAEWVLGGFAHPAQERTFGIELRWNME
ncbi:TonB-dependent receptor [Shewanella sp. D64]|uniref:TonB-dependent receptor n=1 Tax=unclassified Shewanella TaxID=196818 RepID=UPI0022BA64D8|nr:MULTISPECIES: TonB-dependent receptor [unclassified Shewanella]MEC4724984.1 TonB-dependent receptor [Shewanella sp. D64]MEC4736885.1 TonB-dependent receptor [Shewanella sp. E94]WBJ96482.1 TonB-dependent receptor [Shewanella sp. MTB7]